MEEFELTLKTLGSAATLMVGAVTAALTLSQIRRAIPASRARLKADIEILQLLDPEDDSYGMIKTYVDEKIRREYRSKESARSRITLSKLGDLIFGLGLFTALSFLTIYISRNEFNGWSVVTGFYALGGIAVIAMALDPNEPSIFSSGDSQRSDDSAEAASGATELR